MAPSPPGSAGSSQSAAPPSPAALSAFWFLHMAGMGMIFPFQSLYLRENVALAGTQLGLVLAMRPLIGMFAQPFWGLVADRTGSRGRVLAFITLGAALSLAAFPFAESFPALLFAMAVVALFGSSVFSMNTSVTLAALGPNAAERFGRIRVWGTLGFLALVVGFPPLLDSAQARFGLERVPDGPSEPGLESMFWLAGALSAAAALLAFRTRAAGAASAKAQPGDLRRLLDHPPFRRALVYAFLAFLFLQGPILLLPLFVADRGGDLATVSRLWIPMLALEIPLVLYSGSVLRRLGPRALLAIGVLADGGRWLACSFIDDLRFIFALQLLHGVVVAGMIIGLQLYVEKVVPERLRSTAQGLLGMVGGSVAGMLSIALGGALIEHVGVDAPYRIGGACAVALGACSWLLLPKPVRPDEAGASPAA
ncbi:MAG: MFS transporter [Myxococcales bacterium]|nr:MFS transporter [Myxococcales bacterium]